MPFQIIRNDITKVEVDAIVNTANPKPVYGNGVDQAIYKAAGEKELLVERRKIGDIKPGNVAVTPAFQLPANYIIHTVGPIYSYFDKANNEMLLKNCYINTLKLAKSKGIKSIAFPGISTGVYGYPLKEAVVIAVNTVKEWIETNDYDIEVRFCCFTKEEYDEYRKYIEI